MFQNAGLLCLLLVECASHHGLSVINNIKDIFEISYFRLLTLPFELGLLQNFILQDRQPQKIIGSVLDQGLEVLVL